MKKYYIFGTLGFLILISFYFLILSIFNSYSHAIEQFKEMWYWVLLLSLGFGTQIGLYFYMKELSIANTTSMASTAGSSAVSGTSMVACCAHHLSDILPFLGLTGLAIFLNKYQLFFVLLGVFSSALGIIYMLNIIKKHHFKQIKNNFMKKILSFNLDFLFKTSLLVSLIILSFTIMIKVRA
ncbi:hypothetical protein HYV88_00975 [Candidatus Woesearchaeota archaeon]|nr:hypothetical protein [Candidatus Woesearchaeota archaeon]